MEKENCGTLHCGHCEKIMGYFPLDNEPKGNIELYCEDCIPEIENEFIPHHNVKHLRIVEYGKN